MRRKETIKCTICNCKFEWENYGDIYGGGKESETIYCPMCDKNHGSMMTSGFIIVRIIDSSQ